MTSNILLRIKEYIDFKKISVSAFEKSIGMSNASFGKSLKNGGNIGIDKLENILSVYSDINSNWLLTGKGFMINSYPNYDETYIKIFNRIFKEVIPLTDLTYDQFGAFCGISNDVFQGIYLRKIKMNDATLSMIIYKMNLSSIWVVNGIGNMFIGGEFDKLKFEKKYNNFINNSSIQEETFAYKLYKEEQDENRKLIREIGSLEKEIELLRDKIQRLEEDISNSKGEDVQDAKSVIAV